MSNIVKGDLIQRIKRTPTVESFHFRLLQNQQFLPGQFLQVLFNPQTRTDKSLNKYLSVSSSPTQPYIELTKRISQSPFSQRLLQVQEGESVTFDMPMGTCFYKEEYKKIGFLIGGIGITPVISIVEYIMDKRLSTQATVLYSNRTEDEIAFYAELLQWSRENENIRVYSTVTDCVPKDQCCFFGCIDKQLVLKIMPDIKDRIVFIFGPPAMVSVMRGLAREIGCKEENVKSENFTGY
jgi:ferredoxin-NADP reductase